MPRTRAVGLRCWLWVELLCCALCPVAAASAASAAPQKQVLVVYSTRRNTEIVAIGERELPRILEEGLGGVDIYSEYIDGARFEARSYHAAFQDFLRLKYKNVEFDAIVAVGDA